MNCKCVTIYRVRKPNIGDLLTNLLKFEEDLEKREIEREEKRSTLEIEREEKRRQSEQQHD